MLFGRALTGPLVLGGYDRNALADWAAAQP
jgi:hypothetical protein